MSAPGRPEDEVLAAFDDDAACASRIAGAVAVIAAHRPSKEIRRELRIILEALETSRERRKAGRAAYAKTRK